MSAQEIPEGPRLVGPKRGEPASEEAHRALLQMQNERAILNFERCEDRLEWVGGGRLVIHGSPSIQLDFSSETAMNRALKAVIA